MKNQLNRRDMLKTGLGAAATGFMFAKPVDLFGLADPHPDEELVPFLDMPRTPPNRLDWEMLEDWLTPQDQVFNVQHYGMPEVDPATFKLEISGLVDRPLSLSLDEIKALPSRDRFTTIECAGNGSSKGFMNAVYNSRWTGVPLKSVLEKCGVRSEAVEIAFFGLDKKEEVLRPGTNRELKVEVPFGRSMSVADVMSQDLLLAYLRNGEPLEPRNGAPLRLIVPGWYGVANVKWLNRIDVRDRRYMGRYMGRDYVTVRGEKRGEDVIFVESSVSRVRLKSVIARVTRRPVAGGKFQLKAIGAAWTDGTAMDRVEVRLDDGSWRRAVLDAEPDEPFSWRFFSIDLGPVSAGKHQLVSRVIDSEGRIQPAQEDEEIALKKTYWEANQQWIREIEIA